MLYTFFLICIIAVVFAVAFKRSSDGCVTLFDRQIRIVTTNSMEYCADTDVSEYEIGSIPAKSMVYIEVVPKEQEKREEWYASLRKGDVLTFRYDYGKEKVITHRIVEITEDEQGYEIQLAGDNEASNADSLTQTIHTADGKIIGKVTWSNRTVGVLLTAVKSPVGIICIIILPSFLLLIYEVLGFARWQEEEELRKERAKRKKYAKRR